MVRINEAERLLKRIVLSNIAVEKKGLSLTPLLSGCHGIGKSMIVRKFAEDIGGKLLTVEGGSLKEGEITGLPYQYVDEKGKISFRFLPYYAVERIQQYQNELKASGKDYDNISSDEKLLLIKGQKIKLHVVFFDEINRADPQVYKELMNILLTRNVNGYDFPWWVVFIGAMNPASTDSTYATNDLDPAQLDRFFKIDVKATSSDFLSYAKNTEINPIISSYIKQNKNDLFDGELKVDESIEATPSPRGYDMLDTIVKAMPKIRPFFNDTEKSYKIEQSDFNVLCKSKLGNEIGERFFDYYLAESSMVTFAEFINDDKNLTQCKDKFPSMSLQQKSSLGLQIISYLQTFSDTITSNFNLLYTLECKIEIYLKSLDAKTKIQFANDFASSKTTKGMTLSSRYHDIYIHLILPILNDSKDLVDSFFK